MAFFVAANNLMTLFLGLEWFSICLYVLTAITTDRLPSLEAGLKYLIVGSFGSAVLLFGSAFVYGSAEAIEFEAIARGAEQADRLFLVTGLAMIIVGLAFKVSAAPFHMWTPDVYQGAPTPVTAFMSAATKVAALVLTLRLLVTAFPGEAGALDDRPRRHRLHLARLGQPRRARPAGREANARLLEHLARGLPAHPGRRRDRARRPRPPLLPHGLRGHERRLLRGRRHPRARAPPACDREQPGRLRLGTAVPRRGHGRLHVRVHRPSPGRPLPGQVLRLRCCRRPRLGVAGDRGRRRHGRLDLLLPGRRARDVHAAARAPGRAGRRLSPARPAAPGGRGRRARRHGRHASCSPTP